MEILKKPGKFLVKFRGKYEKNFIKFWKTLNSGKDLKKLKNFQKSVQNLK